MLKYEITDISIFKPTHKKEITKYLLNNCIRFELIIIFGGDGTFNEMLNGIMKSYCKPKILYIPCGTINDFGNYLSLNTNYKKSFSLLKNKPVLMDICKVNNSYFSYVLACGMFTRVSYEKNNRKLKSKFGKFYYYFKAIKYLFSNNKLNVKINDYNKKCSLLLFLNISRVGGFNLKIKNKLNDGKITAVLFKYTPFFNYIALFFFLVFKIRIKGIVEILEYENISLKLNSNQQFNTDGEESFFINELRVDVLKEGLEIYISKKINKKCF